MAKTRVLLADDHKPLLDAFEKLLVPEFEVVGRVSDGRALVSAAETLRPDVIVLDISMPLLNGFDAARQLKLTMPQAKLVFLTMDNDDAVAAEAFRLGAAAYLHKLSAGTELALTIRLLVAGD
jgi:DNA-binding NarL/FixJ family response regulator